MYQYTSNDIENEYQNDHQNIIYKWDVYLGTQNTHQERGACTTQ